ncbi:MAG: glycoside hydrolase family 13 protein [Mobilitalea sp.]
MENKKIKLYHNSWEEGYRTPFGAVKKDTQIRLFVETEGISKVWLEIHRDFGEQESREMSSVTGGFLLTVQITETVLHYYHFRALTTSGEVVIYGNNEQGYGGEGRFISPDRQLFDYQITVYDYDDFAPQWYREGVAYHIFIDRFSVDAEGIKHPKENIFIYGRKTDLPMYIKDEKGEIVRWDFFGGNLWGILEKLPYLKKMGITILYLSPLFTARSNHRYDTEDYMHIEPMIGGEEAFTALIKEADMLGMRIILDGVFNHCGADSIYFDRYNRYGNGAYHNENSIYRQWFHITEDHQYDAWWGVADLPRFNSKSEELRSFLLSVVSKWSAYGIGGWRLDVADELEDEFIAQLRHCLKEDQVLLGEVWEDPSNKIAYGKRRYYVKGNHLHGVMNYPYRECILDYLSSKISAREASNRFTHYRENFPPHVLYNNFNNLGSHDTIRLITALNQDISLVKLSVLFLLMLPGVPCIYYGDEIGLSGQKDPDSRRFFLWDQIDNELHQFFQEMIRYRNNHRLLVFGDLQVVARGELLVVIRHYEGSWIYACFNPCDREQYLEDHGYGISTVMQAKDYLLCTGGV